MISWEPQAIGGKKRYENLKRNAWSHCICGVTMKLQVVLAMLRSRIVLNYSSSSNPEKERISSAV